MGSYWRCLLIWGDGTGAECRSGLERLWLPDESNSLVLGFATVEPEAATVLGAEGESSGDVIHRSGNSYIGKFLLAHGLLLSVFDPSMVTVTTGARARPSLLNTNSTALRIGLSQIVSGESIGNAQSVSFYIGSVRICSVCWFGISSLWFCSVRLFSVLFSSLR